MPTTHYDVRDYGAVGDGLVKDTQALQKAIDTCHEAGGGCVVLTAGNYLSGTLYLKNNVELHLANGALLKASADVEDYNPEDIFPENVAFHSENMTARHLIIAYQAENIAITGNGTIDGNSSAFFEPLPEGKTATYRYKSGNYPIKEWRPGQMVFFCLCKNVKARDLNLRNAPYWTFYLLGCEDVQIRGLTIENPPATANGDGLDLDCCRNVTVSDCIIRSGDDSITIRANKNALGDRAIPSENIAVSNCVLSTPCNAIRVGVGEGEIRNCLFNNIVIPEASRGISLVSLYRKTNKSRHGTCIENIHFLNFILNADVPFTVGVGEEAANPAAIRDISFNRFRITAHAAAQIVGNDLVQVRRFALNDIQWIVQGGTENLEFHNAFPASISHHGYKGRDNGPALPCALYGADIDELTIDNLRLRWEEISPVWRDGIFLERVLGLELTRSTLRQPQHEYGAAIHCLECVDILVSDCRAAQGTETFLLAQSNMVTKFISLRNNDLQRATQPVVSDMAVFL